MNDLDIIDIDSPHASAPELVGAKGWHLAQLRAHGLPTPDAFVVTTTSFHDAISTGRIGRQLDEIWETARRARPEHIQVLARTARHLFSELRVDRAFADEVARRAEAFGSNVDLAVRSSVPPTAVSGPECAGVYTSFTNVAGSDSVVRRILSCWASLFGERALAMRGRGLGTASPSMAVVVQPMVDAEKSGIAVPFRRATDVLIEATFGLGEPIVSGAVEPDRYVFDTLANATRSVTIGRKQIILPTDTGGGHEFVPVEQQLQRVLDDQDVSTVAQMCSRIAAEFGEPHEIEWALDRSGLVVLQTRPAHPIGNITHPSDDRVISGLGVGLGTSSGPVRIVRRTEDLDAVRSGDVIVTTRTVPQWRPYLVRAAAIVADTGDEHSHAARIAREYGIPAVVATNTATTDLDDGSMVTVDAQHGWVLPAPSPT